MESIQIKICGLRRVEDALVAVRSGASAIGLNFWEKSPRCCTVQMARDITQVVPPHVRKVGVFVNASVEEILETCTRADLNWVQLHGDEPVEMARLLGAQTIRAFRLGDSHQARATEDSIHQWPQGMEVLLDAYVPGLPGGTGKLLDWGRAQPIARQRKVWLAGGLHPGNVAKAIQVVQPFGVDVASGVESSPGEKSPDAIRAFIAAAQSAVRS